MGCSKIEEYSDRVAIGEEHTRHNWCAGSIFRNLHVVDTSSLDRSLLLLICPSRALSRWEASWLRALSKKMSHFSTIETRVLRSLPLRWGWCSGSPLWLRRPIILRPLDKLLLRWPDNHLLLPLWLIWRSERCLISHSGALGSATRRSSCNSGSLLLKMMKTEVFLHGYSIIYHLIEILKTTAQTRLKFRAHSFKKTLSFLCIRVH